MRRLLRLADETHLPMKASAGKRGMYENLEGFREPRVTLQPRRVAVDRDELLEGSGLADKAQRISLMGRDAARMTTPCLASSARSLAHLCAALPGPCVALVCNSCVVYRSSMTRHSMFLSLSRKWVLEGARPFVAILLQQGRPPAPRALCSFCPCACHRRPL